MGDLTGRTFRVIISYLLPGIVCVFGASASVTPLQSLLSIDGPETNANTRLVYVLLLSLGLGLVVHVFRWAIVDSIHSFTGLKRPTWDDATLSAHLPAYHALIELYYGYYEFCANMALAVAFAYVFHRVAGPFASKLNAWTDISVILLILTLLAGSRDTLQRFYSRVNRLLGLTHERMQPMTNGGGHHEESSGETDRKSKTKPQAEPKVAKQPGKNQPTSSSKKPD